MGKLLENYEEYLQKKNVKFQCVNYAISYKTKTG